MTLLASDGPFQDSERALEVASQPYVNGRGRTGIGRNREQFRPHGGAEVRHGSAMALREFLRHSMDPVDSELSVFQKLLSFGVGK
jgi:hypothetical protein